MDSMQNTRNIVNNLNYLLYIRLTSTTDPYGSIVNNTVYGQAKDDFSMPGGCYDQQIQCYATGDDTVCSDADNFCYETQFANVIGDLSSYDIKDPENTPFPSEAYLIYLNNTEVLAKIGAKSMYSECADAPYAGFGATGDDARTTLPELQRILNEGKVRSKPMLLDLLCLRADVRYLPSSHLEWVGCSRWTC